MPEKIKIIYVSNDRIPTDRASALQVMKTCEALVQSGVELELLIPDRKTEAMADDPYEYYKVERIFPIRKLFCLDLIPSLFFLGPLPYWLISFSFSLSVFAYVLKHRHDFFYFRHDPWLFWFFIFWKKNMIDEIHSKLGRFFGFFLKRLKMVVVINEAAGKLYGEKTGGKIPVILAPDAVDPEDFDLKIDKIEARRKLNLPLESKIVLYSGHLYKWKGVDALLKAAAFFPKDVLFIFVGGETPEDTVLLKKKLPENILFTGQKKYSEIPFYLKAADCLVITGTKKDERSNYFTSPLKLFEYMASGRPIIASDTAAIREVLAHGKNAWLVQADNEKSLAEGIKKILGDKSLAETLVVQARIDVEQYSWEQRGREIAAAFQRL